MLWEVSVLLLLLVGWPSLPAVALRSSLSHLSCFQTCGMSGRVERVDYSESDSISIRQRSELVELVELVKFRAFVWLPTETPDEK